MRKHNNIKVELGYTLLAAVYGRSIVEMTIQNPLQQSPTFASARPLAPANHGAFVVPRGKAAYRRKHVNYPVGW